MTTIIPLTEAGGRLEGLIELLADSVDSGASVGFLPPLPRPLAETFWRDCFDDVARGTRVLLVALDGERVVGSGQLALMTKPNSPHRAEVQKVLVHRDARRRGLGRTLMERLESEALARGRTLLVLDTRRGDDAERLYAAMGWSRVGVIPRYVINGDGALDDTVVFYKELTSSATTR